MSLVNSMDQRNRFTTSELKALGAKVFRGSNVLDEANEWSVDCGMLQDYQVPCRLTSGTSRNFVRR